ncbi:9760_t:CDS:2 [Diversispora eburnea]|uniref:9760_t:CDS:1 n=1 Tax=Diversispora eburnea TaxID=1213867 RepID=A0A9N8Z6V2_9GLOM|nr:9760_t:CDS:2 [Diversispora eburnea]
MKGSSKDIIDTGQIPPSSEICETCETCKKCEKIDNGEKGSNCENFVDNSGGSSGGSILPSGGYNSMFLPVQADFDRGKISNITSSFMDSSQISNPIQNQKFATISNRPTSPSPEFTAQQPKITQTIVAGECCTECCPVAAAEAAATSIREAAASEQTNVIQ